MDMIDLFQKIGNGIEREKQWILSHVIRSETERCYDCKFSEIAFDGRGYEHIICKQAIRESENGSSVHIPVPNKFQCVCRLFRPFERDGFIVKRSIYNSQMFEAASLSVN